MGFFKKVCKGIGGVAKKAVGGTLKTAAGTAMGGVNRLSQPSIFLDDIVKSKASSFSYGQGIADIAEGAQKVKSGIGTFA